MRWCGLPFLVQTPLMPACVVLPMPQYGSSMMKEMLVDVQPHAYLTVGGWSRADIAALASSFSTLTGLAPTFLLEGK